MTDMLPDGLYLERDLYATDAIYHHNPQDGVREIVLLRDEIPFTEGGVALWKLLTEHLPRVGR